MKKLLILIFLTYSNCYRHISPSILNIKCNNYLDSLNNNKKIVNNFKDILKPPLSYCDIVNNNFKNNIKEIIIRNNSNVIDIKLNDDKIYNFIYYKKLNILSVLHILNFFNND